MKRFLDRFCNRFPITYLFIIGVGGAALIILAFTYPLYRIVGKKAMDSVGSIPTLLAAFWMLGIYFKIRPKLRR